jgi:hypothetical protein
MVIATCTNSRRLVATTARPEHIVRGGTTVSESRSAWDGVYTEDQAKRGRTKYVDRCGYCHKDDLSGDGGDEPGTSPPPLAGPLFLESWRSSSLADLFGLIVSTMPKNRPKMEPQSCIDVVSFILQVNGARAGTSELTPEYDKLKDIVFSEK